MLAQELLSTLMAGQGAPGGANVKTGEDTDTQSTTDTYRPSMYDILSKNLIATLFARAVYFTLYHQYLYGTDLNVSVESRHESTESWTQMPGQMNSVVHLVLIRVKNHTFVIS